MKALFLLGLGVAISLVVLHALSVVHECAVSWHLLVVLMGVMPAIAAALGGYAEKMALSAQSKRYEWMSSLFSRAARHLRILLHNEHYPAAQQLVFDLGKEALEENGDWVIMHRERTADVYRPS